MFIAFLRFSKNKHQAADLMARHNEWINSGLADGVFLLVGSLQPGLGGAILAHHTTREELEVRLQDDPFVARDQTRPAPASWPITGADANAKAGS